MSATPTSRRRNTRRSWSTSSPSPGRWHREASRCFHPIPNPSDPDIAAAIRRAGSDPPLGVDGHAAGAAARPRWRSSSTSRSASAARPARSACLEWNDMREEVGVNVGVYDNPHDLTPDMFTLMRFTEWENPETQQSRMADPQGRLHALRGSGLPQGLPGARRDRAVLERHRRLRPRELHRLRLLHQGMPVQHPAHLQGRPQGLQVHALLRPRRGRPGAGLRQGLPDPGDRVRHQGGDEAARRRRASPT